MSEPGEIEFSLATTGDKPALIEAVKTILEEGDSHNASSFNTERWEWQYERLPGFSLIYTGKLNNEILAYYHVPVYYGKINDELHTFAMVQDVAVSNRLRGKGVFRKIAEFATHDIKKRNISVAYTFPNDKSIHTFLKYNNYQHLVTYRSYILPINVSSLITKKTASKVLAAIISPVVELVHKTQSVSTDKRSQIILEKQLSKTSADLFDHFSGEYNIGLLRKPEYMKWRFFDKPGSHHFIIEYYQNNELKAVTIFKKETIFGSPCLLLMDFAYSDGDENYMLQLIQLMRSNKNEFLSDVDFIFTSGCGKLFKQLYKSGFIPVPARLNPRPLKLLVNSLNYSGGTDLLKKENWHATLADWDVF